MIFIGSSCSRTSRRVATRASARRARLDSSRLRSVSSASPAQTGKPADVVIDPLRRPDALGYFWP